MNPTRTLHILHLEDDPLDAELIHRILSDNRLSDIDGVEALALVRHSNSTTPFIFTSGWNDDPEHVQHLRSLGATAFISKADMSRLKAWLQTACDAMAVTPDASYQYVEALEQIVTVVQGFSLARTLGAVMEEHNHVYQNDNYTASRIQLEAFFKPNSTASHHAAEAAAEDSSSTVK